MLLSVLVKIDIKTSNLVFAIFHLSFCRSNIKLNEICCYDLIHLNSKVFCGLVLFLFN